MGYTPVYEPFDLGAFDPALGGEVVQLLRNPTRAFRQSFLLSAGEQFLADVAFITRAEPGEIEAFWNQRDAALFTWLFVPWMDGAAVVLPHVYAVWDAATKERIKKLAAPSPSLAGAPTA
jgi:hypothetical protein